MRVFSCDTELLGIRSGLRKIVPGLKAAPVAESLARGLGFRNNMACVAALRSGEGPATLLLDADAAGLGHGPEAPDALRALAAETAAQWHPLSGMLPDGRAMLHALLAVTCVRPRATDSILHAAVRLGCRVHEEHERRSETVSCLRALGWDATLLSEDGTSRAGALDGGEGDPCICFGPASSGVFCIDIAVPHRSSLARVVALAESIMGRTPFVRRGVGKGASLLYRRRDGERVANLSLPLGVPGGGWLEVRSDHRSLTVINQGATMGGGVRWDDLQCSPMTCGPDTVPDALAEAVDTFVSAVATTFPHADAGRILDAQRTPHGPSCHPAVRRAFLRAMDRARCKSLDGGRLVFRMGGLFHSVARCVSHQELADDRCASDDAADPWPEAVPFVQAALRFAGDVERDAPMQWMFLHVDSPECGPDSVDGWLVSLSRNLDRGFDLEAVRSRMQWR